MTDEAALLRAVIARPDDDTPRLAYADWLDDHDRPERAAFIRVQVELARTPEPCLLTIGPLLAPDAADHRGGRCVECRKSLPAMCRYHELNRDAFTLIDLHGHDWFAESVPGLHIMPCLDPVPGLMGNPNPFLIPAHVVRGFVDRVAMPAADWLRHADTILAAHPVRRARLTTADIGYADDGDDGLFGLEGDPAGKRWTAAEVMDYRLSHPQLMFADDIVTMLHMRWDGVSFEVPPFGTIVPGLSARGVMESAEEEAARHERLFDRFYEMGRRVGEARERAILDAVMGLTPATATIRGFLDPARPD